MIFEKPSPNYSERPAGVSPSLVVVHGTVGTDAGDLAWLTDRASQVSYHYLVLRDGTTYRLVSENKRAWHAGRSEWRGRVDCNDYSIGIGLSNQGPGEMFPQEQIAACGRLVHDLMRKYQIPPADIVGHSSVSPGRKTDPWLHFPWSELFDVICARAGAAFWGS